MADVWKDSFAEPDAAQPLISSPASSPQVSPFLIDMPESFENSPCISFGDLAPLSALTAPLSVSTAISEVDAVTPMASPLNNHSNKCKDAFCALHDNNIHWAQSPSVCSPIVTKKNTKKRTRRPTEWSDAKRKYLTNMGEKYISKRGKAVDCKTLGPPCSCRFKCASKISQDERHYCFRKFWKLGSREKQWSFVVKYTNKHRKYRCLNSDIPNNRQYTFKYTLPLPKKSNQNECSVVEVCKTMFLNTLAVSGRILKTSWAKYDGSTEMFPDLRGRHNNHKKVINPDVVTSVCDHVNSFVPVESHYVRKNSKKLYLDSSLSIARMFKLYVEWFDSAKYKDAAKTERQYRDIVNENFNLSFFRPKKDQCDVCQIFCNKAHPTDEENANHQKHLSNKKIARDLKTRDKCDAISSNGTILAAVFDFQKVLCCPHGNVSIFYYKRKLSFLNFTVFDMGEKRAVCYMWDETVAKRGANEVSSCLLDYIEENVKKGVGEFRFWSDNCAGQNKNRFIFYLYIYAASKYNVTISHRFLEKGHTQNEGDSVHALIERKAENKIIYTPDEWRLLVRWAKSSGEPYVVRNMSQENFFDFKSHVVDKAWSKNIEGHKVAWNNIREVMVNKSIPNQLLYKYDLNDANYGTVVVRSNTRRTNTTLPTLEVVYKAPIGLSKDKKRDLISMCTSGVIGAQYHDYFEALPVQRQNEQISFDNVDN